MGTTDQRDDLHLDEPGHISSHIVNVVRLGVVRLGDLGRADSAVVKYQNCVSVLQESATAAPSKPTETHLVS